ncbi:MAG: hypothetical protein M3361_15405 [Candidatus Tectomicrobia bacterium]|nr:hypothetical protein [Candidatus Tectomicrobia bacterium]
MSREIFLKHNDGQLMAMREQAYDSEAVLQDLLARNPRLLVGEQIDPAQPRRWLLITREADLPSEEGGSGRWAVDHLFLDQAAVPTLVEVKRSRDPRLRREVVGQMLDYAANAVIYWPIETLQAQFERQCQRRGVDPDGELASFLERAQDPVLFWQQAKTNLQAGKIRLLFVADEIPAELRRMVAFLNQQMDPAEVLAIEMKQCTGTGVSTLVPAVVGQTAKAEQRKGRPTAPMPPVDPTRVIEALQHPGTTPAVEAARRILEWARGHVTQIKGRKGRDVWAFVPTVRHDDSDYQLFAVGSNATVVLLFQYYQRKPPFEEEAKRREVLRRLNAIDGVSIPPDAITRRPAIPLAVVAEAERLTEFLGVFEWFIHEVQTP